MKNIQIIDGAVNATYSIFEATDDEFLAIFPNPGQDIELVEDFVTRAGQDKANRVLSPLWQRPIHKSDAQGIHGTLYYDYQANRKHLPHSKRELDRDAGQINDAQRALYAKLHAAQD